MRRIRIAPSILSADFSRLGDQVQEAINAGAEIIHVDIMDGHFVPNLTIGPRVVEAIKPIASSAGVLLDAHLMIENPERMIPEFARAGVDNITVHVEACPHLHRIVQQIKGLGISAGVTLNPATSLITLEEILPYVDLVLILSVNPGFGGQVYIPTSTAKINHLRKLLEERHLTNVEIEVDGGVNEATVAEVVQAGATLLVAGSAVFNQQASIANNLRTLQAAIEESRTQ